MPRRRSCSIRCLQPGDEFIASTKLYGGSINQFNHAFKSFGWQVNWADPDDPDAFRAALSDKTKAIFMESIANPGGVVSDIEAIAAIAREAKVPLIVDNTLATPYLIRPIDHGADIVVHSATKYLGGHGNSMGGVIVDCGTFEWMGDKRYPMLSAPRPEYNGMILAETFGNFAFAIACRVLGLRDLGPAISPFNSFLILNGIETLSLRMQRHCDNALAVARHLAGHAKVGWVSYAGLEDNRHHALAQKLLPARRRRRLHLRRQGRLCRGRRTGEKAAILLPCRQYRRHPLAGDPPGLHHPPPAHRRAKDRRRRRPDVVRLSIGLEDVADLIADLDQALGSRLAAAGCAERGEPGYPSARSLAVALAWATAIPNSKSASGLMRQREADRDDPEQRENAERGLRERDARKDIARGAQIPSPGAARGGARPSRARRDHDRVADQRDGRIAPSSRRRRSSAARARGRKPPTGIQFPPIGGQVL